MQSRFTGLLSLSLWIGALPLFAGPDGNTKQTRQSVPGQVLVRFRESSPVGQKTAASLQNSVDVILVIDGHDIAVKVERFEGSDIVKGLRLAYVHPAATFQVIDALKARPDVLYAEPNYVWRRDQTPDDPRYPDQWHLKNTGQVGRNDVTGEDAPGVLGADIDAESAWDITTGSDSVVVAVLDGGIDVSHEDVKDNIWVNPGEIANDNQDNDGNGYIDDLHGWDFHHNDKTVFDNQDGDDHATIIAGIIGARGNNGGGVVGINWNVRIMSLKVLGPQGGATHNIIRGYQYARMMRERGINIRVLNNSYGGPGKSQAALEAIEQLNQSGILFVAAAGNDSRDNFSFPHFPSGYDVPNIVGVAATDRFDQLARFSNFSARRVSMGAPGRSIWSTVPNNLYNFGSGTSFSSPLVAGTAALVLAAEPDLSVTQLRGVLVFSGERISTLEERTTTGRRLNALSAIQSAREKDTAVPAAPGGFRILSQSGRTVTLSWTAPGDDSGVGSSSDYDFFFISPAGGETLLPTTIVPAAAGSTESTTVTLPFRNLSGAIQLRTYDNAGNTSTASVPVNVSVNSGIDPYVVNLGGAEPLSSGGTALELKGDDLYRKDFSLPFPFPFYGTAWSSLTISTNGALYFSKPPERDDQSGDDAGSSIQGLNGQTMIAAMWDDLRTDRAGSDVFVVQPDSYRIIFRWEGVTFDTPLGPGRTRGENPVNFEIELQRDGIIQFRYGSGQSAPTNTGLFPVVGISAGEPDAYVVASHTSEQELTSLTNAPAVSFFPRRDPPVTPLRRRAVRP